MNHKGIWDAAIDGQSFLTNRSAIAVVRSVVDSWCKTIAVVKRSPGTSVTCQWYLFG